MSDTNPATKITAYIESLIDALPANLIVLPGNQVVNVNEITGIAVGSGSTDDKFNIILHREGKPQVNLETDEMRAAFLEGLAKLKGKGKASAEQKYVDRV